MCARSLLYIRAACCAHSSLLPPSFTLTRPATRTMPPSHASRVSARPPFPLHQERAALEAKATAIFKRVDADGSGCIDCTELRPALIEMGISPSVQCVAIPSPTRMLSHAHTRMPSHTFRSHSLTLSHTHALPLCPRALTAMAFLLWPLPNLSPSIAPRPFAGTCAR